MGQSEKTVFLNNLLFFRSYNVVVGISVCQAPLIRIVNGGTATVIHTQSGEISYLRLSKRV